MTSTLSALLLHVGIIISGIGISILITFFFGIAIGIISNLLIFVGIILYVRRKNLSSLSSLFFGDRRGVNKNVRRQRSIMNENSRVDFICLICGSQVKGVKCNNCGQSMKKATFR